MLPEVHIYYGIRLKAGGVLIEAELSCGKYIAPSSEDQLDLLLKINQWNITQTSMRMALDSGKNILQIQNFIPFQSPLSFS